MTVDLLELNRLPIDGPVVIGEGERDEAPMLFIGEQVGAKIGPKVVGPSAMPKEMHDHRS